MPEDLPDPLTPADEGRHAPDPDDVLWNESWYLDFASADGRLGGYVRYSLYPNAGVAWLWACLVGEGRDLVATVDHALPLPDDATSLDLDAGPVHLQQDVSRPFGEVTVRLDCPATRYAQPDDLEDGHDGAPARLTFDLTWLPRARPYPYPGVSRYEVPCVVRGRVGVDGEEIEVDADGERDHSWGHRDWWAFPWIWTSGRLDDGTFLHGTRPEIEGVDYQPAFVVPPDAAMVEAARFEPRHDLDDDGRPRHTDAALHDLDLRITPVHVTPLRLDAPDGRTTRLVRALCRFEEADGRSGHGWTEWNQPRAG